MSIPPAQTTLAVVPHPATLPVIDLLTCHAPYGRFCVANCFWWASCPTCFHVQAGQSAHPTMLPVVAVAPVSKPANDMHAANHLTASSRKQNELAQALGLLCLGCGVAVLQLAMFLRSLGKKMQEIWYRRLSPHSLLQRRYQCCRKSENNSTQTAFMDASSTIASTTLTVAPHPALACL